MASSQYSFYTFSERYEDGQDDHQRIIARGDGLTKAIVKEQSEFIIDGSDSNQG